LLFTLEDVEYNTCGRDEKLFSAFRREPSRKRPLGNPSAVGEVTLRSCLLEQPVVPPILKKQPTL
jgi:hypothetical protein